MTNDMATRHVTLEAVAGVASYLASVTANHLSVFPKENESEIKRFRAMSKEYWDLMWNEREKREGATK